ncbi:MAG: hypothetical protein ACI9YE_000766 [Psychroserpens sp.]|jgi:hypothetical protein
MNQSPVLLLTFNRPRSVKKLMEKLISVNVKHIYVSIDGPRNNKDKDKINEIISIVEYFRRNASIKINAFEKNLGCGVAVPKGISWFFENVEEGIILEDDCFPDETFFPFCSTLLNHYRENEQVMHICGSSFNFAKIETKESFFYSRYANIWGWATWRRDWEKFDDKLSNFSYSTIAKSSVNKYVKYFLLKSLIFKESNAWSFQWVYMVYETNGLAITPYFNLIRNTGYDSDSSNTLQVPIWFKKMRYGQIKFPLVYPISIGAAQKIDTELTKSVHYFSHFKLFISFIPVSLKKKFKKHFLQNEHKSIS